MGPVGANVSSLSHTDSADNSWPVLWAMCWIDGSKTSFHSSTVGRALALICVYRMPVRDDVDLLGTHKLLKLISAAHETCPCRLEVRGQGQVVVKHVLCQNDTQTSTRDPGAQQCSSADDTSLSESMQKCNSSPAANTQHLANDCGCAARGLCVCTCPRPLLLQEPWITPPCLRALVYSALPRNTVGGRQSATFFIEKIICFHSCVIFINL